MEDKTQVGIALRCLHRVEDTQINVQRLIRSFSLYDYYVVVISSGAEKGFVFPKGSGEDCLIEIPLCEQHVEGDSQSFAASVKALAEADIQYGIVMTGDNWILDEAFIETYIEKLILKQCIWISSSWCRINEAATDMAFINVPEVVKHNVLWPGGPSPETWVFDRLQAIGPTTYQRISEIYPIHYWADAKYLPKVLFDPSAPRGLHGGRIYYFPQVKMVTHHVEHLSDGMQSKKYFANQAAGRQIFSEAPFKPVRARLRLQFSKAYLAVSELVNKVRDCGHFSPTRVSVFLMLSVCLKFYRI